MCRTDLGNVHWRKRRSHTDAHTSDEACDVEHHKIVEVSRGKCTHGEQYGSCREQRLSTISVGERTSHHRTHKAADEGSGHGHTLHERALADAEEEFVERLRSTDHNPVVTEEQTAHGAHTADEQKIRSGVHYQLTINN